MSSSEFDKDSAVLGFALGMIIGIVLCGIVVGLSGSCQTECKEFDGIQVCRKVIYYDWRVKEAEK